MKHDDHISNNVTDESLYRRLHNNNQFWENGPHKSKPNVKIKRPVKSINK